MAKLTIPKINFDQQPVLREKVFFFIALSGLLVLFVNLFWGPLSLKFAKVRTDYTNVKVEVDMLTRLIESTRTQLRVAQSIPKREVEVDDHIKKMLERKVVDPLSDVHSTVAIISGRKFARGTKIEDVKIGTMVEKDDYWMVPITIQLASRYGGVRSFFSALEKMDRPVVVDRFDLREGQDEGMIEGSIDIVLYIVKR
jgi:Tfp pilus assembly protein PilO